MRETAAYEVLSLLDIPGDEKPAWKKMQLFGAMQTVRGGACTSMHVCERVCLSEGVVLFSSCWCLHAGRAVRPPPPPQAFSRGEVVKITAVCLFPHRVNA